MSKNIYVASSWKNEMTQQAVVHILQAGGFEVYDFINPPNSSGFGWEQVDLGVGADGLVPVQEYLDALDAPRAIEGFTADFDALKAADAVVLVLPCNRSAHLELGWAVGAGKATAVLLDGDRVVPELMYGIVDFIATDIKELLGWLGVKD